MKILLLNYEYPPLGGGAANATKYILKEFSKYKNLEIDLVTSSIDKFKIEKLSKNITIHYLDIGKDSTNFHNQSNKDLLVYSKKAYFYSKKLIKQKDFDLIHAFFGIPCGFIAKKLKLPYIVSLRGSDVPFYSKKYYYLDKLFFKRLSKKIWAKADYVIANSYGLCDLAKKTSPKQKIGVISNGVDINEFMPKTIKEKSIKTTKTKKTKNKLKILCVGRLIERKGFSYVIDALKQIKIDDKNNNNNNNSNSNNISLTFIGEGPLEEQLKKESIGLDVTFLGLVEHDKLADIYNQYDVFILPSFNEGMSNTVLEAIASGLAIIITDTGGTKELIDNNGFIVRTGNFKDISDCLKRYIQNENLLIKHKIKSREIAKKLSWKNVSKKYYELYQNMIKN